MKSSEGFAETSIRWTMLGSALLAGAFSLPVFAQNYPVKPIRNVLEFPPGDGGDATVRLITKHVADFIGQPIVIDNRPGAGGVVAAELVVRAAPDGYTLLTASPNALVTRRFLAKGGTSFDTLKDLTPITIPFVARSIVVATPSLPANTFKEMLDYAKANPGKLSYGTSGHGSQNHLAQEMINQLLGLNLVHVPYKGAIAPLQDAAAGLIPLAYSILPVTVPQVRAGKVKPLAMVDTKRYSVFPDIPSISEVVPGWEPPPTWLAMFGPANLPMPIARRLHAEVVKAMNVPEVNARMNQFFFEIIGNSPEDFAAQIKHEMDTVARIVKSANIQQMD